MVDFDRLITRSTSHLGLLPSGEKRKPLLSIVFTTPSVHLVGDRNVALNRFAIRLADHQRFFRKPTSPPLSLREGPPLSPSPFPLRVQGMYQPPYSVLKPLRYKVGGPSEVYASFLCGMGPQGENLLKNGCVGWDHRDKMDGALRNLLILSSYSP